MINKINTFNILPDPEPEATEHSRRLSEFIQAEINSSGGSIPFLRFMDLALYSPGLGYYNAGARKFGADGDFVTAPELSALFSRCVARQCQQILARTGGDILELGAGSGIMAADILRELETLASLPIRYEILELSGELRERQRATIYEHAPHLLGKVSWLNALPEAGFRGVILGNEVLDALPVHRFRITDRGVLPLHVSWGPDGFAWCEGEVDGVLTAAVRALEAELGATLPIGYESEVNPYLGAWLSTLSELLDAGALLFVDYGYPRREYYHHQRNMGTLICHYRHRVHTDPLILVGIQDITASVDFTAVAQGAAAAGLELAGYTSQSYFLFGCDLDALLAEVDPEDTVRYLELVRRVKILTLPGEMGERFKAIALSRGLDMPLRGFALFDERIRL
jgi:SAM-dependent MidA family methyltransferase